jgi:hypothetical protein
VNAHGIQHIPHVFQLEGFDNGDNQFHQRIPLPASGLVRTGADDTIVSPTKA